MKDVFISYKSENYDMARWVRDYLVRCGLSVWMAPEDIPGGGSYAEHIPVAIENCKAFVLILSEKAQHSKWVKRELDQAINDDKEVLPFMIEKAELTKEFRFYLANIQGYPAYEDMPGQLDEMAGKILALPGISVNKTEEKKPVIKTVTPAPQKQKADPSFAGLGLKNEAEKIRYAFEESKRIYDDALSTTEQRNRAFELVTWAVRRNDPESTFLYGTLLLRGKIMLKDINSHERGMFYLDRAAWLGHKPARRALDDYCAYLYNKSVGAKNPVQAPSPLRDSDGWRLKINHNGKHLPVNAVLDFDGEVNRLYITANINIMIDDDETANWSKMANAVMKGMQAWSGSYTVFGGQRLDVLVDVNVTNRIMGVINIISARGDMAKVAMKVSGMLGQQSKKRAENLFSNYGSFSTVGMKKWSIKSNKNILIYDRTGRFDDYEKITEVVRYEFGAMLGLENMFVANDGNEVFIPKGTYPELDPYYIENGRYNLVMSNGRGVISNNDIEMVVLAFAENEMQYYLEDAQGHKPSKALGKGN